MRKFVVVLTALVFCSSLLMAQSSSSPDPSAITEELMAEYQKLTESNDAEGRAAIVKRVTDARLAKSLEFLGSRKALFPIEIECVEKQLSSTVFLVLDEGSKPDIYLQAAQWNRFDVGIIALSMLVDYDCHFIDTGFMISDFKRIRYNMENGYSEQTQKCAAELWEARKNLLYAVDSPLLRMWGTSMRQEGLRALDEEVTKQMAYIENPAGELKYRIEAIIKLRRAFLGLREMKADPKIGERFPEGSEDGTMFTAMAAKDTAYLASLLALAKAKDSDPELRLAAACAWTAMETDKLTKAQIAEIKKDKFRGVAMPELSRYATLPSTAPSPLLSLEDD